MDELVPQQGLIVPTDIELLIHATLNEKNAPELLHYQADVVDRLQQALTRQESHVEALESDMSAEVRRMLLGLEVRRVRYLLKAYLRTRIAKVEKWAATLMDDDEYAARMSPKEAQYCHDYFVLLGRHLTSTVLQHLPDDYKPLAQVSRSMSNGNDLIPRPLLDSHVFVRVLSEVGSVTLADDQQQSVDFHVNDTFIIRYNVVKHLVHSQQVVLL